MKASISKIESMGLSDGPGIRTVIFFNGCKLRCKYCHNPETWQVLEKNVSIDKLIKKILRYKNYYGNDGGVTFSGGEPLLHVEFLIPLCEKLKKYNINIALDTSGVGIGKYKELFKFIDLVLLDIKEIDKNRYKNLTGVNLKEFYNFINELNKTNIDVYIRQVIIPDYNDNLKYMDDLKEFLMQIKNIKKIELLPFHNMANTKYQELKIKNEYDNLANMDRNKCLKLEEYINKKLNK